MIAVTALIALALAGAAQDVETTNEGPLLDFYASWPAAADAQPALREGLRADAARREARAELAARQAERHALRENYPYVRHATRIAWRIEGSTPQLVSLSAETSESTGGGHSSDNYYAMLWDRVAGRPTSLARLINRANLVRRYCAAYPAARANHLGDASGENERQPCPALGSRPIAPADTDGNGRFDMLRVFMAVNYFEADGYSVDVTIQPSDLARIPAGLRPAFEVPGER